jgi:hypothetical protein
MNYPMPYLEASIIVSAAFLILAIIGWFVEGPIQRWLQRKF